MLHAQATKPAPEQAFFTGAVELLIADGHEPHIFIDGQPHVFSLEEIRDLIEAVPDLVTLLGSADVAAALAR